MKTNLLLTALLLIVMGANAQIFQPKVDTSKPSVMIPKYKYGIIEGGISYWSSVYMYQNKAVLEIDQDSVLTVHDAKLAGKRLMEDREKDFHEMRRNYKTIDKANELINFLILNSSMNPKDIKKLDKLIADYSKQLNSKPFN